MGREQNQAFLKLEPAPSLPDIFQSFLDLPYPVLLDRMLSSPLGARFSYLTADPFVVVRSKGQARGNRVQGRHRAPRGKPF